MTELTPIPTSPDFRQCFGCGPDNAHGTQLSFGLDAAAGRVQATWTPPAHFAGYRRMLHGGVVATLLDEGMGWALWGQLEKIGVTRELRVTYQRPVVVGHTYRVLGWVGERADKAATVHAEVRDRRDRVVATGVGEFALVAFEKVRDAGA